MDLTRAQDLIDAERARVRRLLDSSSMAAIEDREAAQEAGATSIFDSANPLEQESVDDAVAEQLTTRLAALDRASARVSAGTYGRSVLSGQPIPDERLEADPAAEVTIEEATKSARLEH